MEFKVLVMQLSEQIAHKNHASSLNPDPVFPFPFSCLLNNKTKPKYFLLKS